MAVDPAANHAPMVSPGSVPISGRVSDGGPEEV